MRGGERQATNCRETRQQIASGASLKRKCRPGRIHTDTKATKHRTQTRKQPSTGKQKEGDVTEDRLHQVAAGRAINRSTTKLQ